MFSGMTKVKMHTEWTVLPHGPIEELAENLWRVQGSLPGMSLKRTMTVTRLTADRLLIHGAIALRDAEMKRIEDWGVPTFLVVPNGGHRLDAPAFKKRYPHLRVVAPRGSRTRIEAAVAVDLLYDEFPPDETVRFEPLHGIDDTEGAMIVRSRDGVTVVLNDAVYNMDRKRDLLGLFFTTVLGSAPGPRVSRLAKLVYVKDKRAFRSDLERLARTPDLKRLVVSHEKVAHGPAAAEALRQAATSL